MVDIDTLNSRIEAEKENLFDLLCKLVQINSENFGTYGNEEACARYVAAQCEKLGLETDLYSPMEIPDFEKHPDYMAGRNLENRYNVTARWKGTEDTDALMIMGHSDTVPIGDPANWTVDPLGGILKDGKIWGRGACDDKYALAAALFVIELLQQEGFTPKKNLLFTAYSDEEKGGSHGALAACLRYPCDRILNMDGRFESLWHCASGGGEGVYKFHTAQTVDSAERAAYAIPVVLDVMKNFAQNRFCELAQNQFYAGSKVPQTALRYMGVSAGNNGSDLGSGQVGFAFYTDKTKDEIYEEFAQLEQILSERLAPMDVIGDGFSLTTRFFHYVYADPGCDAIRDMCDAAKEAVGQVPVVCGSCLSDLSVILKYGSAQAFALGAGRDFSMPGGAHQPDEYIACSKLVDFAKVLAAYILKTLG